MMPGWSDEIYEALAVRSQRLYKNKHLLPVATWIAGCKLDTISAPDVTRGLDGRLASNKALEALERLQEAGVMHEFPYTGRPHARMFERLPGAFWRFAEEFASETTDATSNRS
jgi:hypothetical protein